MFDRSNHKDVQVVPDTIQQGGVHYIESVFESFKTMESAFANKARDLCNTLGGRDFSDELIHDSIAEMRAIVQKVHIDAKATVDTNRQEFTEVRRIHPVKSRNKTISVDPNQYLRASQRYQG
jgi:hypothetical protein